jgi:hypothetical protein
MVWHIFKKDWRLTWPMAAAVAAIHFILRLALYQMGHFGRPLLASLLNLLIVGGYLGSAFLIVSAVHQDAIPGVRQDWLVRPILRRDLLAAKFLFVLVLVQTPMSAADVFESLLYGFSPGQALASAFSRGMGLLFFFCLAMLVFASLTRSFTEAIVGGSLVFAGGAALIVMAQDAQGGGPLQLWVEFSGLSWIEQVARMLLTMFVAVAVLGLQYFRRKTRPSRWIFGAAAAVWVMVFFTPWQPAFAIQKWASPHSSAAGSVAVAFAAEFGSDTSAPAVNADSRAVRTNEATTLVSLPLRVIGLPKDSVLKADHYQMRVIPAEGKSFHAGAGDNLEVFHEGTDKPETTKVYQVIRVPADVYDRVKDQPVHLEIDYSLTLMKLTGAYGIPALQGDQRTPELGWCKTRVNEERTAVQLRCVQPGNKPNCFTSFLENASTGQRNPARSACSPNYSPYVGGFVDALSRFGANSLFRDPTGLAHYPVDAAQLRNTRMVVRVYRTEDHFTQRVTVPAIRLGEWVIR